MHRGAESLFLYHLMAHDFYNRLVLVSFISFFRVLVVWHLFLISTARQMLVSLTGIIFVSCSEENHYHYKRNFISFKDRYNIGWYKIFVLQPNYEETTAGMVCYLGPAFLVKDLWYLFLKKENKQAARNHL